MAKNYEVENYYFVDYENVASGGLAGVECLGKSDRVRIFYGSTAGHVAFELLVKIAGSDAEFEFCKVEFTLKNALDFRLLFDIDDISRSLSVKNYYIVSNDTDYDEQMKLLRTRGINISKVSDIAESRSGKKSGKAAKNGGKTAEKAAAVPEEKTEGKNAGKTAPKKQSKQKQREAEIRALVNGQFGDKDFRGRKDDIAEELIAVKTKAELNNRLQKKFGNAEVKEILSRLKPYISGNLKKS
ncbi:MAG: hypothetical protein IK990_11195 [Ruminiclostridium sp.]|nr:hypothetical protein [Ruminiclostridium sp.]